MVNRILFWLVLTGLVFANDQIPGPPQSVPILLRGGYLHTVSGPDLADFDILFIDGKITAIDRNLEAFPNYEIHDIRGRHVYPGLIAASTTLGLVEIAAVRATSDYAETGDLNPNIIANRAYNTDSESIPVTRSNGILLAHVTPQSGLIGGQSSLMMLDGWSWEDATLIESVGMHVFWPSIKYQKKNSDSKKKEDPVAEAEARIAEISKLLSDARAYQRTLQAEKSGRRIKQQPRDLRLASLQPVIAGRQPLFIHARSAIQIEQAINWTRREGLKMVLVGGHDLYPVMDLLGKYEIPVIIESLQILPLHRHDHYDQVFSLPVALHQAGIRFAISGSASAFEAPHQRNLPFEAAQALPFGLPRDMALRSITLSAAEILGADDRVGSLEIGKDATLIVTDGDILEISTQVIKAWIQGRRVDLDNRHEQLYRKYREKYRQLGELSD